MQATCVNADLLGSPIALLLLLLLLLLRSKTVAVRTEYERRAGRHCRGAMATLAQACLRITGGDRNADESIHVKNGGAPGGTCAGAC